MIARLILSLSVLGVLVLGVRAFAGEEPEKNFTVEHDETPDVWTLNEGDHERLFEMFTAEQEIRQKITPANMKEMLPKMAALDKANRAGLIEIGTNDELRTPYDFFRASIMFAHQTEGDQVANMQAALEYAITSMRLGCPDAPYTVARTYDRLMTTLGRGQRYGTQFGGDRELLPIDEGVVPMSATVREQLGVPAPGSRE